MFIGWFVILLDINAIELTEEHKRKLNELLYFEINQNFFEDNKEQSEVLMEEFNKVFLDLKNDPENLCEVLKELLS